MATINPRTPVLIGVGQSRDRIGDSDYRALSPADLAAEAAKRAMEDAWGRRSAGGHIDVLATTRTVDDTISVTGPFGRSGNFPRSVCRRLRIDPPAAVWGVGCGTAPQELVIEYCERIGSGEIASALVTGAEAISTTRHALAQGTRLDFAEEPAGSVEDRGAGIEDLIDPLTARHGITGAPVAYALFENARRARLGISRETYSRHMAELFAPFAATAHANRDAAWDVPAYTPEELLEAGPHNRMIADPYPMRLVARDQVNLGAAVLITSVEYAQEIGVPEAQMVFLQGYARAQEQPILDRPDLGASEAAQAVCRATLARACTDLRAVSAFDFYSCFPIAVFNAACDGLGLAPDDPRGLTVTGGLPFFGGPGNNYTLHAIAAMVARLRAAPRGSCGFVGANGGLLSKYNAALYTTVPCDWEAFADGELHSALAARETRPVAETYDGLGRIETYTIAYRTGAPARAIVVGRTENDRRFIARSVQEDTATMEAMQAQDPLDRTVEVRASPDGENQFTLIN